MRVHPYGGLVRFLQIALGIGLEQFDHCGQDGVEMRVRHRSLRVLFVCKCVDAPIGVTLSVSCDVRSFASRSKSCNWPRKAWTSCAVLVT